MNLVFLVSTLSRSAIRGSGRSADKDIIIGVLLAAMNFEWTVRRAIVALGWQKNTTIRKDDLRSCHGLDGYNEAWKNQVTPRFGERLPRIIPDWNYLKTEAYPLRHLLIHGEKTATGVEYARDRRDSVLATSNAVAQFARSKGVDLYAPLPVRKKDLSIHGLPYLSTQA